MRPFLDDDEANPSVYPAPSIVSPVTPVIVNAVVEHPSSSAHPSLRIMSPPSKMYASSSIAADSSACVVTVVARCRDVLGGCVKEEDGGPHSKNPRPRSSLHVTSLKNLAGGHRPQTAEESPQLVFEKSCGVVTRLGQIFFESKPRVVAPQPQLELRGGAGQDALVGRKISVVGPRAPWGA